VKRYEKEFINQGGDSAWLGGLDFIPPKLRAIYDINKILAHRPWLLRKEHIEVGFSIYATYRTETGSDENLMIFQRLTKGKNSWSLSEVVHAMVLLSHFHSLSSFVFSCGLTQKLDCLSSPKLKSPPAVVAPQELGVLCHPTAASNTTITITPTSPTDPQKAMEISINNAKPDYNSQTAAENNGGPAPDSGNATGDGHGPDATALNGYLGK